MTRTGDATLPAPSSSPRCRSQSCSEDRPRQHSNAQHPAQLPADAQHTPLSPRLGSGGAGETDEGNFLRKHGCGDAQLGNKCSQSGIQNLTHSSTSELKRTGHIQQKLSLLWGFLPKPITEKEAWDWPLRSPLALDTGRISQPRVNPEPVSVTHPKAALPPNSVFGFTWSVQAFPPACL